MAKKKEDIFEQVNDIFEQEEDYNPTDKELLSTLVDPQMEEDTDLAKQTLFVAKLQQRMSESEEFKNQVEVIIRERITKSK